MFNLYDILYGAAVVAAAPAWALRTDRRNKVLRAFVQRFGQLEPRDAQRDPRPAILIHAVSVGEINATRALVATLAKRRPELRFIVSTTTDTGYARGQELYGRDERIRVIRFPLDFTPAVRRVLEGLEPRLVVLMELEVWPNFIHHCARMRIPVVLVNGRLTPTSFRNYRLVRPIVAGMFRQLNAICVQEEIYADRFIALGARPGRVKVTRTMKFDTAQLAGRVPGDAELAGEMGVKPAALGLGDDLLWVCGSTGPGEEKIVLDIYRELKTRHPDLRLAIVPRHPQRFDEVANLIQENGLPIIRRSAVKAGLAISGSESGCDCPVVLGDTMGELRKFYSLASVVFVGRSLVDLGPRQHGSDMIEPAALGKPVVVGPFTGNFAEVMSRFNHADAMRQVSDPAGLKQYIEWVLTHPAEAQAMGDRAQQVVREQQGATTRHAEVILSHLDRALAVGEKNRR